MTHCEAIRLLASVNAGYVRSNHPFIRDAYEVLGTERANSILHCRGKDMLDLAIECRGELIHEDITKKQMKACRL